MGIDRPSVAPAAGAIWPVFALAVPLGIVAVVVPALNSAALEQTVVEALIKIVAVVGLYIFIGNSGIMSFGHVAFMAVGAYAAAWQTCCPMLKPIVLPGLPDVLLQNTVPNFPASVASGGLAAAVALAAGAVILRLSGIAASIASFALLFIVNVVYSNADRYTHGVGSLVGLPMYVTPLVAYGWAVAAIVLAWIYQRSRFGVALRACREDEIAAKAAGINVYLQRLIAFVLSASLLGVSGALYGSLLGTVSTDTFFLDMTFMLVAMLVVGGLRSLAGAVVGVVAVSTVVEVFRQLQIGFTIGDVQVALPAGLQGIALAAFMLAVLIFRRQGIMGGREVPVPHSLSVVIAGLVPAIPLRRAQCVPKRDGRDKPGHDTEQVAQSHRAPR
jgi:branched-chain amino acid transport system permease protein